MDMHVIRTQTDETRYLVVEHIAEIWTEQAQGKWHVPVRLAGVAIHSNQTSPVGNGVRTYSTHESEEEASSAASGLAQRLFSIVPG
jgi:hypothetical protein